MNFLNQKILKTFMYLKKMTTTAEGHANDPGIRNMRMQKNVLFYVPALLDPRSFQFINQGHAHDPQQLR